MTLIIGRNKTMAKKKAKKKERVYLCHHQLREAYDAHIDATNEVVRVDETNYCPSTIMFKLDNDTYWERFGYFTQSTFKEDTNGLYIEK